MQISTQNPSSTAHSLSPPSPPCTPSKTPSQSFPYSHLMFHPSNHLSKLLTHCNEILQAITFIQKFIGVYETTLEQNVKKLAECLEQPTNMWTHQKILFIDIDDTLMTRVETPTQGSETIMIGGLEINFKVRPFAIEFLQEMSHYYDLILFSSSEEVYSRGFFDYFNTRTGNCIRQYLSRDFCIQAFKNVYFKDLRVIQSRQLKDMILVDNSVFSFGVLVENGVPIMRYDCSDEDRELEGVMGYLKEASQAEDVREFNRERLRVREITRVARGE